MVSALEASGRYSGVFAQPAAGNAGTALGAALHVWHENGGARIDAQGYSLGPEFSAAELKQDDFQSRTLIIGIYRSIGRDRDIEGVARKAVESAEIRRSV